MEIQLHSVYKINSPELSHSITQYDTMISVYQTKYYNYKALVYETEIITYVYAPKELRPYGDWYTDAVDEDMEDEMGSDEVNEEFWCDDSCEKLLIDILLWLSWLRLFDGKNCPAQM